MPLTASTHRVICKHCGTPFQAQHEEDLFCCSGCSYVYGLIHDQNLNRYYELRTGPVAPVGTRVFHSARYDWLTSALVQAEAQSDSTLTVRIQGLSCAACVWLVEHLFQQQKGALQAIVNVSTGKLRLRWEHGQFDAAAFAETLHQFGYRLGPDNGDRRNESSGLIPRIGLCGAFAMNAMLFSVPHYFGLPPGGWLNHTFDGVAMLCATLSMLVGGSYFIRRAWMGLRNGVLHIDTPIALGLIVGYTATACAWITGRRELAYFDFVSLFSVLMLTGRWLQERVADQNRAHLLGLSSIPEKVDLLAGKEITPIPLAKIQPGMRLRIQSGEVVPVRSRLLNESAEFGLEWISGESEPREFSPGSIVPSGSFNLLPIPVEIEAVETWKESLLYALTAEPEPSAPDQRMNAIIRNYLILVVATALIGFTAWIWSGDDATAVQVLVSTLVISCPCAIGVSLPLADEMATAFARNRGCFVHQSSLWHRLRRVRSVAFDKTGTLTLDVPQLRDSNTLQSLSPDDLSALSLLVSTSLHPVGKSLREALRLANLKFFPPQGNHTLNELPGVGMVLQCGDTNWKLGRPEWTGTNNETAECVFSRNGNTLAVFSFIETLRRDAAQQIESLRKRGCDIWILSGDRRAKVETLAQALGLPVDHVLSEATPQQKAEMIRHLGEQTLMIGDGANDSLAFRQALCSGTPAIDRGLLENRADFYFTGTGLEGLSVLLDLSRQHSRAVHRVMVFTISYNIIAVGLALAGWIFPLVAAVLMPASSVVSLGLVAWSFRK